MADQLYIPDGAMKEPTFQYINAIIIVLAVMIAVFISCQSIKKPETIDYSGFSEKHLSIAGLKKDYTQKDTLANISIKIPARLDTFYQWQHYSDCTNCGYTKYRFADKRYTQFAEKGFFWTEVPDSVYQLSIWHKPFKIVPDTIVYRPLMEKDSSSYPYILASLVSLTEKKDFYKKEFRKIGDNHFVIAGFTTSVGYLTNSETLYLIASTRIKNRDLHIIAECGAKDTTGFIDNMYKAILSVKIEEK